MRGPGCSASSTSAASATTGTPCRRTCAAAVTATGIGGAGLLGISLSAKDSSPQFYILTTGLAGAWAAGALSSGPLPLDTTKDRDGTWRRPVVMPVLTGAGAFGLFYGAARLARHIPRSTGPSAASCTTQTTAQRPWSWPPRPPTRWPRNYSSAAHLDAELRMGCRPGEVRVDGVRWSGHQPSPREVTARCRARRTCQCYLGSSFSGAASRVLLSSGLVTSTMPSANFRWAVSSCSAKS